MFCTLKQSGLSNEAYTFETTTPPFSRKREGRLAKIACKSCRTSKLKCSGEPEGCHRCLSRKTECCYPSTPRGNGHKKNTSSPKPQTTAAASTRVPTGPTPPETPQSPSRPLTDSGDMRPEDDEFMAAMSNPDLSYGRTLDGFDLNLGDFVGMSDFTTPESMGGVADGEYIDPTHFVGHQSSWNQALAFEIDTDKSSWTGTFEQSDISYSTGNMTSPETLASSHAYSDSTCSCYSQAIGTYEAIEVAAWGQREEWSNADDVLRYQKRALSECEELLECASCSKQSSYTMLVLSMCSRILSTLEELCQNAAISSSHQYSSHSEKKRRKHEGGGKVHSSSSSSSGGGSSKGRRGGEGGGAEGYGISIRNRQLDDDDEHLVLQSLLTARVARLGRLLNTLDNLVGEHSWPAHKGLIRDLQARLSGSSFIVNKTRRV